MEVNHEVNKERRMDETRKFGDFFDDEMVEVEQVELDSDKIPMKYSISEPKSEEKVHSAIDDLINKYNLPMQNYSVKEVLDNIDSIDTDNESFDLVASKIVTDYVGRVALRGVITEASMIDKILTLIDRVTIDSLDGDSLLYLSKVMEYQDKLFAIMDRYKKSGVTASLKHISEVKHEEEHKEEKIELTPTEIKELLKKIKEENHDPV